MIRRPNKTFILDIEKDGFAGQRRKHFVIVTASDIDTAAQYINDKLNGNVHPNDLTWLMYTNHPTIYDQTGRKPLKIQVKLLYNTSTIIGG